MSQNNSFGSFIKILVGIGLAILIFMSYMLAEQRGWVNTNIAGRLLRGVEDGKAIREEQSKKKTIPAKQAADDSDKKIFGETAPVKQAEPKPAPAVQETNEKKSEPKSDVDDSASEDDEADFGDDGFESDDETDASADEAAPEKEPEAPAEKTAEKSKKPAKLDYSEVARKRSTWPKAVQMRVKGTRVPMLNKNGTKIGEIEVPVGTRLFVLKVTDRGILEVKSAVNGQIFQVHASRTTFSRLYTGKPISDSIRPSSSSSSDSAPASDDEDSGESDDFEDSDSEDDSSDDDFSDDDFFDDDF